MDCEIFGKEGTMRTLAHLIVAGAAVAAVGQAPQALATSSSVVYAVEGNPGCKQILTNSINELKTTSVVFDSPTTLTSGAQSITYTVSTDGHTIVEWSASRPVNAVVIKKSGNAGSVIYHFGNAGVSEDTDEPAGTTISAISFCWGLTGTVVQESAYEACPPGLEDALMTLPDDFVLFGVERDNIQAKPFQCVTPVDGVEIETCSYNAGDPNPCQIQSDLEALSIDIYQGSTSSCNTSGGKVKCNTVNWP
jgi:hypothetical protein